MDKSQFLIQLVQFRMPFGRYKNYFITALPVSYLEWFSKKGWPAGQLGQMLSTMYEIKINGIEDILRPIIKEYR